MLKRDPTPEIPLTFAPMFRAIPIVVFWSLCAMSAAATEQSAPVEFASVKAVFAQHCVRCHGPEKQESGLRLDSGGGILLGGDSGAVVAAKDFNSRILVAISGGNDEVSKMPPEGPALSADEIAQIKRWIEQGAAIPDSDRPSHVKTDHWSFRPISRPRIPETSNPAAIQNSIDAFIISRLEKEGLAPSAEAEKATLIRRLNLDLLGLPPSPEDVERFLADRSPDAYSQLVDRTIASPAYGERWGRHWLDVARYADSNGYTRDFGREIWKYREWVIHAVNADLPFDRFTIEQIAGDMLPEADLNSRIATGFHRNTLINEEGGTDPEQFRVDAVADRLATTGEAFLGLTVGCARCHSHKYDPISQREYYQLFAFLNNCNEPTIEAPSDYEIQKGLLDLRERIRTRIADREAQLQFHRADLDEKQKEWEKSVTPQQRARLPGPVQVAYDMPFEKRDAANKQIIEDHYYLTEQARRDFPLLDEIARLREIEPKIPKTLVMVERSEPRKTHIQRRGDFLDLGEEVSPSVPSILHPLKVDGRAPNRLDFASWLVARQNPLTARVTVNRHWQHFFGRGLVETENDFGTQGSPPTHPELLDYLASEFVEGGWSVKRIHRFIVTSATYRQSSRHRADQVERDPYNKYLSRQNRIRLEAEIVRDAALCVSGLLAERMGGPSVFPPQPEGVFEFTQDPKPWPTATGADRYRRGMYTHFWRSSPYPALMVFDAPSGNVSCTRRVRSNTPLQALTLANDVQFMECAQGMARRIIDAGITNPSDQANFAFRLCLSRSPSPAELERFAALTKRQHEYYASNPEAARSLVGSDAENESTELAAWTAIARVLLNLDEFICRE